VTGAEARAGGPVPATATAPGTGDGDGDGDGDGTAIACRPPGGPTRGQLPPEPGPLPSPAHDWPLVGRDDLLTELTATVLDADGRSAVLVGPAGCGKTSVARALLARAAAPGWRAARVLATRSASSLALGALGPLIPAGGPDPSLQEARAALLAHAGGHPLLLVVDDAHLLDPVSAAVLLSAAQEPTVRILATVRAGEVCPDAITALWKDAGAERVEVGPLDRAAVEDLLTTVLGGPPGDEALDRLLHLSGGSPLHLRELVAGAERTGQLRPDGDRWVLDEHLTLPPALVDLVAEHLGQLAPGAVEHVALVALTEPLPVEVVDRLDLRAAMEVLESRGIVHLRRPAARSSPVTSARTGDAGDLRLAHPLHGEVAVRLVGDLGCRRLLSRSAAALAGDGPGDLLRSVLWRRGAGEAIPTGELLEAARRCYRLGDYRQSGELAGEVWERERTVEAGHLHGFALGRSGEAARAELVLAEAAERADGDRETALVTMTRVELRQRALADPAGALALCTAAEHALRQEEARAELTAHRAMAETQHGLVEQALATTAPIVADPDRWPRAYVRAAYATELALAHSGRPRSAGALAIDALPKHEALWQNDLFQTEPGVHHLANLFALIATGHLHEALPLLEVGRELTRGSLPDYAHGWVLYLSGLADHLAGLPRAALDHLGRAEAIFRANDQREVARWCAAAGALAWQHLGEPAAAHAALGRAAELRVPLLELNEAIVDEAVAWCRAGEGDREGAVAHLLAAAERDLGRGDRFGGARLLHTAARLGSPAVAERLAAVAEGTEGVLYRLFADHARALDPASPPQASAQAAADLEANGLVLWAAEAAAEAARRFRSGGDQRAGSRWAARSGDLLDRCQGATTHLTLLGDGPEPLTARERDVARLAAQRLPSKEIAARLRLSRRTVDNHLRRIYRKLGITGRHELNDALRG